MNTSILYSNIVVSEAKKVIIWKAVMYWKHSTNFQHFIPSFFFSSVERLLVMFYPLSIFLFYFSYLFQFWQNAQLQRLMQFGLWKQHWHSFQNRLSNSWKMYDARENCCGIFNFEFHYLLFHLLLALLFFIFRFISWNLAWFSSLLGFWNHWPDKAFYIIEN